MNRKEAEKIAHPKACDILLNQHTVEAEEVGDNWILTYTPKGRVRGGGFRLTISKSKREVTDVLMYQ